MGLSTSKAKSILLGAIPVMLSTPVVLASSTITNPLTGNQSSVSSVINSAMTWILGAVAAFSGAWLLFHLYLAIMGFIAGSKNAQRRDEAKTHLWHVVFAGVLLGGAGVLAGAVFNLGASFK